MNLTIIHVAILAVFPNAQVSVFANPSHPSLEIEVHLPNMSSPFVRHVPMDFTEHFGHRGRGIPKEHSRGHALQVAHEFVRYIAGSLADKAISTMRD